MRDAIHVDGDIIYFHGVKAATITAGNLWPSLRTNFERHLRGQVIGDIIEHEGVAAALINGDLSASARADFVEVLQRREDSWRKSDLRADPHPLKGDLFQNPNQKKDAA